ncbi:unnamed protein product [Symbiodinium sp. KB8]|nr:unnamed protein product [Symbiodinium sp. KB8]
MAPSSGGAAHDYMHKLKYILNTTPELSLPKVLAQTQVPHFAVWVDGRKSPLKFPYEEGNHFVTELRHEVMRGFRCFAAAEDTHAMNDSRTGRNDCFLCSHVWRQGSRYGVCFENSCLRSRPQGLPLTELQLNSHDDGVSTRGDASLDMDAWAGNHACCGTQARATSAYRDCQKRAAEDGGDMGSYLDFGYRTSLKAVESAFLAGAEDDLYRSECAGPSSEVVGTAFAQGILGSKCALWGGQYSYQAAPIQHFRYDEQDALTKDLSFGDGDQTFDEATTASDCNSETSYGDKTSSLSEPILEVCPIPKAGRKKKMKMCVRPDPLPESAGRKKKMKCGQLRRPEGAYVYGGFIWEDALDAGVSLASTGANEDHGGPSAGAVVGQTTGPWLLTGSIAEEDFSASIRKFIEQAVHKAIQDALQGMSLGSFGEIAQEQPGKGGKKGLDAAVTPGAAGKGRGQEGGHKGKGKGPKGSAIKPPKPESGHESDEWTTVSRQKPQGQWQLRDADWSVPTFGFDGVAEAIEKATGVFKAVVLCGPEQADLLATILLGSKKPHGVIAVTPDHPEASARCPGAVGNSCVFKLVQFHHISSAGVELPGPKVLATKAPKVVASKTAVMYVRVYKKYVAKNAWKDILANPQRAFHHWIAQQHMKVQDSWGWAKEQTQGEDSKIYALFRVPEADVAAFAALSGRDGFFIDPPRWTTFPAFSVQWAEKEVKETDLEFLQRVRAVESKFGVVVGRRGLGKRIARDANQAIPRTWLLEHAPFDWGSVQASKAVSTIFENVTMLRQQRTRWAPVRAKPQAQTIRTNGSWSLLPPRDPFAETTKVAQAVSQDDAEEEPAADAPMEASSKQATSEGKEAKREATSKGKGVAKRVCTETRDLPKGVEQQQAPTDGSCLFHAASAAIAHILKCEPEAHSVLRAKVVQHFKKNSSRYEAMWAEELPDRSQGNSFQDYISAIAVVDTWAGPMELAALGRIYDIKFVIYPRSPDLEVCAVHVNQRKRVAALAFTGSHYEWLKPVSKLPQELCDVITPPPQVPMRGGGKTQHDTASYAGSVRSDAVHRKSMLYEHYRCPLCTFGIPARDAFSKSADAVTADKFAHCKAAHVKATPSPMPSEGCVAPPSPHEEHPGRAHQSEGERPTPFCHDDFQFAAFVRIATLNTAGKGISVIDEVSNFMDSHQLQICTVAEADVNVASAPGYIRAWKLRGYQAALSVPEPSGLCRVALISRVNFRVFKLAEGLATNRCVAGFFEFLCDKEVCQFVIASFYGQSGNAPAAAAQAEDVLAACSHSHLPYIVAGDFNLEPDESILGEARAMGVVKSLDDASCGAPLPATGPGRKRRIDHALSHWSVAASAILHFDPHFSDHASVCYEIPLDAPPFHVGPRRRPMNHDSTEVIADRFSQVDCAPFREALAQGNVDNAWCILSGWAEDCLTMNDTETQEDHLSVLSDFVSVELPRHQAQEAAAVKVKPSVHHHAIDQVLAKVPAVRSTRLDLQFNAESLRSIAASIADKAPGPDSWQAGSLYKMPLAWWAMAAELWSHVWSKADVPTAWKYAKVTLIRKKGGPTTRPITLTQIMWRIGAKFVARALRQWAPEWASESDHGGLPGRSFSDVLFQVQAALNRGMHTAALMDVAGYFDAMNAEMVTRVFTHLGAPVQLAPLLESFYSGAFRYFCFEGSCDPEYHVVHSGIAQGCPLSPIAAAALSHCWSEYIKSSCNHICVQIFMDDRTLMLEGDSPLKTAPLDPSFDQISHQLGEGPYYAVFGYGGDTATVAFFELLGSCFQSPLTHIGLMPFTDEMLKVDFVKSALGMSTTWFFNKAATATALHNRTRCLCGSSRPSRAHLLWVCPRTEDIRKDLEPPKHRGEERLLSKHLREQPLPPPAVDAAGLVEEIADTIRNELVMSQAIVIATDGSAKDGIAAHSVVVNKCDQAYSGGNDCEDQSPFRAEMCALRLALEALSAAVHHGARGSVIIAVDCEVARIFN